MANANYTNSQSKPDDIQQYFGFLPPNSIAQMQSTDYQKRIECSQEILEYVPTIPVEEIDFDGFLRFIQQYVTDANLKVAQNCSLIIEEVITELKKAGNIHVRLCVSIAFDQLKDNRRFVIQLGGAVIGDLLRATDQKTVFEEIVRSSASAPSNLLSQIYKTLPNLIQQNALNPSILIDYSAFFDTGLTTQDENVKQSALWCLEYLKANFSEIYDRLYNLLSSQASRMIGRSSHNPATAIPKNREFGPQVIRQINTAGAVEAAKINMTMSQKGYRRPLLPSQGAGRLLSKSRPITSTFPNAPGQDANDTFNFEPVSLPVQDRIIPPQTTFNDDEVIFEPPEQEDSGLLKGGAKTGPVFRTRDIKTDLNNPLFDTELELDETKPKVGHAHFDAAVLDEVPAVSSGFRQPKPIRAKVHKEYEELPSANFGGSHFDENAFNEIKAEKKQDPFRERRSGLKKRLINLEENKEESSSRENAIQSESIPPNKKKGVVNFDGLLVSNAEANNSSRENVTPEKKRPKAKPHVEIHDPDSRPIKTSGAYDIGEDLTIDAALSAPIPKAKPRPRSVRTTTAKERKTEKPPPSSPPVPKTPTPAQYLEDLQSDDWEKQNKAIEALLGGCAPKDLIKSSLRTSMSALLECAQSTRTALSKNALNLVLQWIKDKDISVAGVADVLGTRLLKLMQSQSSHHFIQDLTGECFLSLLENVPDTRQCAIISREHKSPYAAGRALVALGAEKSVERIEDPTPLLVPLAYMVKDADQETRKHAKVAIKHIAAKKRNFVEYVKSNVSSQEDQNNLIKASTAP
ncbi:hypothetical protein TVAG_121780 [Trichomonas vaginalis G3]|uniref:TOG domain-containing protein n=1 Tax=Trichomonas vaginalis (strain ATCC PRA-98 / G3) TaxID=412133 RepID=A2E989_TRIV3|nr:hypothetical protein TVAGG3_0421440 [Trichomonas vaginalis G3]EAY10774.1 hypothetical protein TVAG_121780 [Trichomonas vaginalis G3]KAI5536088.1 hypothetical protein TVAGG3_0421440 [Trichomonas vaginalis G3]|eukprot:XP_001322997.1 hypothetical protein [Trichomonas vaginalis G3]